MDADAATDIARSYFKKQCAAGLSYLKVTGVAPMEGNYLVLCEHKCLFDDDIQKHRLIVNPESKIIAVQSVPIV